MIKTVIALLILSGSVLGNISHAAPATPVAPTVELLGSEKVNANLQNQTLKCTSVIVQKLITVTKQPVLNIEVTITGFSDVREFTISETKFTLDGYPSSSVCAATVEGPQQALIQLQDGAHTWTEKGGWVFKRQALQRQRSKLQM